MESVEDASAGEACRYGKKTGRVSVVGVSDVGEAEEGVGVEPSVRER